MRIILFFFFFSLVDILYERFRQKVLGSLFDTATSEEHEHMHTIFLLPVIVVYLSSCSRLSSAGLPQTKLGSFLETRVNDYLKRQSHPESGEVTIRVVHVSDKVVEVKPGMKSR